MIQSHATRSTVRKDTYPLPRPKTPRTGFTLIEIIVAGAVLSVAITAYISMFSASLDLSRNARNRGIATTLAEEQMTVMLSHPNQFIWEVPEPENDDTFDIWLSNEEGDEDPTEGNPFDMPGTMPAAQAAFNREEVLYDRFSWKAFGRIPADNPAYFEVTVLVLWKEAERPRSFALSSSIPKSQVNRKRLLAAPTETNS